MRPATGAPSTDSTPRRARWRHGAGAGPADADAAIDARTARFPPGRRSRRPSVALLLKAADLMDARIDAFIATGVAETGATPGWIGFNVTLAANMLREAASMTTQIAGLT